MLDQKDIKNLNDIFKDYDYVMTTEYSGVAEPCFPLKEPPNIPVKRANLSANESQ